MARPRAVDVVRPRRIFSPGTRIEAVEVGKHRRLMHADRGIRPGTPGRVRYIDQHGRVHVTWADGQNGIILPDEQIRVLGL